MTINKTIEGRRFDEERALYHLTDARVENCTFAGPADGESALKESRNIAVNGCHFSLRYPLWHARGFELTDSALDGGTRAPIWYASDGLIRGCTIEGVKCVRECSAIRVENCRVTSPEFGWKSRGLTLRDSEFHSEYFLLDSSGLELDHVELHGKYSFQYTQNVVVRRSVLDTKDAFWHSKNVTVEDSEVRGEYLGWYSDGLTLVRCHIVGTQPLCYCTNLRLIDCTMEGTDLAFEYSDVEATVRGRIESIRSPRSGHITAGSIGAVLHDADVMASECEIRQTES